MSEGSLVLRYAGRLIRREWRRFVLPFFSLIITTVVLLLILLLTKSGSLLLQSQAKELLGGDVVVESTGPVDIEDIWQKTALTPAKQSDSLAFNATLGSAQAAAPFEVLAVDTAYPLIGMVEAMPSGFSTPSDSTVYLDQKGADRLQVTAGDKITMGTATYTVAGIITKEPSALVTGFRLFPQAIMSQGGFEASGLDPSFLRIEYRYSATFANTLSATAINALDALDDASNGFIDIDVAGSSRTGLQFGLNTVAEFLTIVVLITAVLAAVNVYASAVYLVTVEERSLAIMLALGMRRRLLFAMLASALLYVVIGSFLIGTVITIASFFGIVDFVATTYSVSLPTPDILMLGAITLGLLVTTALGAFTPAVLRLLGRTPRAILLGDGEVKGTRSFSLLALITVASISPLAFLAYYLLQNIFEALMTIGAIIGSYVILAVVYQSILTGLYRRRHSFRYSIRSIIAFKKADGLFGVVSFTSLFIALTALSTLTLSQVAIERYLTGDLARTVPTTYVLDIQPSQVADIQSQFPDVTLFSNTSARIVQIDDINIAEALEADTIDRELRREFNITSRKELLESEVITSGVWHDGRAGEASVDSAFADRSGIILGSTITFLIQGLTITTTVTSIRDTDQTSGLPFFYFVLSPEDLGQFPSTYFGYSFYEPERQAALTRFIAETAPNVSVIETQSFGPLLLTILSTLVLLVTLVTLPPLLIATLLIATLTTSVFAARRREGARSEALGATKNTVMRDYIIETTSLTVVAALAAYLISLAVTYVVTIYVLELDTLPLFTTSLAAGFAIIVGAMTLLAFYLFKSDTMPLRALLSYESNR